MHTKVLVVGDVMVDRYLEGPVSRLSPEAPVPVVSCPDGPKDFPGGAAHVALALAALGTRVGLIGRVGEDYDSVTIETAMAAAGVWYEPAVVRGGRTITKTRVTCAGRHLCRIDTEPPRLLETTIGSHITRAASLVTSGEVGLLVLSDYGKGVLTADGIRVLIDAARAHKVPVVVDPKHRDARVYRGATVVTPNFDEAVEEIRHPAFLRDAFLCASDRSAETVASLYADRVPETSYVIVTRGAHGCTVFDGTGLAANRGAGVVTHHPAFAQCVYDPTGAGDVFVAGLATGLFEGRTFEEALRMAVTAAGVSVGVVGTSVVFREDLDQLMDAAAGPPDKLMTPERAIEWARRRRESGQRVVFTNGCFDGLHPGHLHLLRQARAYGDRVVVGINTDESVRRLKGPDRPRTDLTERMTALALSDLVDAVVPFDQDTPEELVHRLRPDVLAKGDEYKGKVVAGADFVSRHGGRVVFVPMLPGYSTTARPAGT